MIDCKFTLSAQYFSYIYDQNSLQIINHEDKMMAIMDGLIATTKMAFDEYGRNNASQRAIYDYS